MPIVSIKPPATPEITAIDQVFEKLLSDIVSGAHPAGSRLPAERELSRQLGASRPTLREALRRLGEWNLVEPRRGSGGVVRPYRDWAIEVMAAYLRYGKPQHGQPGVVQMLLDVLAMRRAIAPEVVRLTPRRGPHGGPTAAAYRHSATARAVLRSLVPVICPPEAIALGDAIIEHMEPTIAASPAAIQRGFAVGLVVYDLSALPRHARRARSLAGDRAERYYCGWLDGPTSLHRQLARGIKQLMSLALYGQPEI